ncbi:hypothetical protein Tco_0962618 [Tanacetum coccineum]
MLTTHSLENPINLEDSIEQQGQDSGEMQESDKKQGKRDLKCTITINRGLIQVILRLLPPQPIREATKASNLQRIPPGVQGRSHFTYFLYLIVQIINPELIGHRTNHSILKKHRNSFRGVNNLNRKYRIDCICTFRSIDLRNQIGNEHSGMNHQEVILFYNGLDVPTRQILDSKGVILTKTATEAKVAFQEMAEYSQKWHNRTSSKTKGTITINRGLIQVILRLLPPQPIGEATKASNLQRIPPGVQGRSHFTYFLYLIVQIMNPIFLDYHVTLGFGSTGGLDLACPTNRLPCHGGIQWVLGRITNSLPGVGTDRSPHKSLDT